MIWSGESQVARHDTASSWTSKEPSGLPCCMAYTCTHISGVLVKPLIFSACRRARKDLASTAEVGGMAEPSGQGSAAVVTFIESGEEHSGPCLSPSVAGRPGGCVHKA